MTKEILQSATCILLVIDFYFRYGEIIWLKVYEYPYWPAMVLDPRWLPLSLIESLKINKKKAHNRVIVQFIDEYNSSYKFTSFQS